MNEQLKLCLRAHAEPAYKEACDRTIKFLDITRFAQKECTSPLHVLGLPFNDTLFRVTIGIDHALTVFPKTPNPTPRTLNQFDNALFRAMRKLSRRHKCTCTWTSEKRVCTGTG